MNRFGNWVFIELDEHEAALRELRPGWNLLDCTGDSLLKRLYLEQELSKEDFEAWQDGVITDHFWLLLDEIGAETTDIQITYSREHRRYEVSVV